MPNVRKLAGLIADKVADDSCRTLILVDTTLGLQVYATIDIVEGGEPAEPPVVDQTTVVELFKDSLEIMRTAVNRRTDDTKLPIFKSIGDAHVTIVVKLSSGEITVADVTTKTIDQHLGFAE